MMRGFFLAFRQVFGSAFTSRDLVAVFPEYEQTLGCQFEKHKAVVLDIMRP